MLGIAVLKITSTQLGFTLSFVVVGTQALSNDQETWLYLACLDVLVIFSKTSVAIIIYRIQLGPKLKDKTE